MFCQDQKITSCNLKYSVVVLEMETIVKSLILSTLQEHFGR